MLRGLFFDGVPEVFPPIKSSVQILLCTGIFVLRIYEMLGFHTQRN